MCILIFFYFEIGVLLELDETAEFEEAEMDTDPGEDDSQPEEGSFLHGIPIKKYFFSIIFKLFFEGSKPKRRKTDEEVVA